MQCLKHAVTIAKKDYVDIGLLLRGDFTLARILIVDDEPDISFILKIMLEKRKGFRVDSFNDPEEALHNSELILSMIEKKPYIILDLDYMT